jgi:ethanolamine utilization protein EutN
MLKGKVIGNIVSTNKLDKLIGYKFLEIQVIEKNELTDKFIVAVDRTVSAGIGEEVLVTTGSSARVAVGDETSPVDAVVVGVVDKK